MRFARLALLAAGVAACGTGRHAESRTNGSAESRPWALPGDKIDSILPMPEYLRRFRAGLTEPAGLSAGATSREELARRFLSAVTARDTAGFAALVVTRTEFAWLVFPLHKYHDPPYELDPEIFWMQLTTGSARGLHRTLTRYGGTPLALVSLGCSRDTLQAASSSLRIWSGCIMQYRADGQPASRSFFGSVVERDGRFKLLSFANDF